MKRVVVTGMGAITSLGTDWAEVAPRLAAQASGVRRMDEWDIYDGLNTRLGAPVDAFTVPEHFSRKQRRSMGRVAMLATRATEMALEQAGLREDPVLGSGRTGVAYGSSTGSTDAASEFNAMLINHSMASINGTTYIRMMPHTAAVNIGVFFGLKGRVYTTCSACTSGSQGIGYAFEAIRAGVQDVMVAGGAEELCPTEAAVFDTLYATSCANDAPGTTPRPFDVNRDGLVIGEGAGTLILEERDRAIARGATILAEIVGFGTNADGVHVTQPDTAMMGAVMELALADAGLTASDIDYVNAHGTATDRGDIAEGQATARVLGPGKAISSLKGHFGHTLGACGAIESWATIAMLGSDWYAPTAHLQSPDPECGDLDFITGDGRGMQCEVAMSNNFAFGGINTSLIFKRAT